MTTPRPPRRARRGASTYRFGHEITLLGHETEDELPRDGVPREYLHVPFPVPARASGSLVRRGASVERVGDEVVLVGDESPDEVSEGVPITLSPLDRASDG